MISHRTIFSNKEIINDIIEKKEIIAPVEVSVFDLLPRNRSYSPIVLVDQEPILYLDEAKNTTVPKEFFGTAPENMPGCTVCALLFICLFLSKDQEHK